MTDETNAAEAAPVVDQPTPAEIIYAPISVAKPGSITYNQGSGKYTIEGWIFDLGNRPQPPDWQVRYGADIANAVLQYIAQVMRHGPMRQPKPR